VFDHSARDAEHLQNFLLATNPGFSGRFLAPGQLFGNSLPNAAPTGMQAAQCGKRSAGATIMVPSDLSSPLALRPREAAKALGISARHLWQLTKDGHIPCVRVGSGTRKTVLYPVADLQAWPTRQAQAKGGEQ
jgi:excisionase family DNA binding protein